METAWIEVASDMPVKGFELFTKQNQMGGYTGVGIGGKEGVFPKLETAAAGATGIAFINIGNRSSSVVLTAIDDHGNPLAAEEISLNPFEKKVMVAEVLFSRDIGQATYIDYSSDEDIAGFQLNGDPGMAMLDGLQGTKLVADTPEGTLYYKDADVDGYSDGTTLLSAGRPSGGYHDESEFIATSGDRDDGDSQNHPEILEVSYSIAPLQTVSAIGDDQDVVAVEAGNLPRLSFVGKPVLPVVAAKVILPDGHEIHHIEVVPGEKVALPGAYVVEHGEQPYPLLPDIVPLPTLQDAEVYSSYSPYPEKY